MAPTEDGCTLYGTVERGVCTTGGITSVRGRNRGEREVAGGGLKVLKNEWETILLQNVIRSKRLSDFSETMIYEYSRCFGLVVKKCPCL